MQTEHIAEKLEACQTWVEDHSFQKSWRTDHKEVTTRKTLEGVQINVSRFVKENSQYQLEIIWTT